MPKNTGTIRPRKPYSMITASPVAWVNVGSRFHVPCSIIASSRPAIGASTRTRRSAVREATPSPTPVIEVKRGWANPNRRIRTMKMAITCWAPVAGPYRSAPAA